VKMNSKRRATSKDTMHCSDSLMTGIFIIQCHLVPFEILHFPFRHLDSFMGSIPMKASHAHCPNPLDALPCPR
jgi:hypothetical protein